MALILSQCYSWDPGACQWSMWRLWSSWDWFARGAITLLALMTTNTLVIACERLYCYAIGNTRSRIFRRDAGPALRDGRFDEVTAIAARNSESPIASVVAESVRAFGSVPAYFTTREAIDAAERASQRLCAILTADWSKGLGTLKTIAALAPFVGLVGTCFGVLRAFSGSGMQKDAFRGMIAWFIATALVVTAFGLFVGILAVWLHNALWRRVEVLRSQMLQEEANTLQSLKAHPEWRSECKHTSGTPSRGFLTTEVPSWEVSYDRQGAIFVAILACSICLIIVLFRLHF